MISYWSCPLTRVGVLSAGGMSIYILNFVNKLGEMGHIIDIYARSHKEEDESIVKVHKNVRIIHLCSASKDLYKDTHEFSQKLYSFIRKNSLKYDIIHSHYFYSALVGLNLKGKIQIPIVHTFHSLAIAKRKLGGVNDQKRIAKEKFIVKEVDGLIVSTTLEKNDLLEDYHAESNKIAIVSPGVNQKVFREIRKDKARKKLGFPDRCKFLLFVGRIDPIKSIETLILALDILIRKYKSKEKHNYKSDKLQVVLIGGDVTSRAFRKNKEVQRIMSLIEEKNLECCVKFIGSKPHNELPYYYSAADVVVLPSVYESFGLVILEAMACGSLVVASRVGGLKYLIKDKENGLLFESGNSLELSEKIWIGLHNRYLRNQLKNNAGKYSHTLNWDKQAKILLQAYSSFVPLSGASAVA